jgi:glucokinase
MTNTKPVVVVDIGGTKILTALFSGEGKLLTKSVTPTLVNEGQPAVVERLVGAIGRMLDENRIKSTGLAGICIACAGGIDTPRGVVMTPSPNLPDWANVPLGEMVWGKFGVETQVINDASAAALGEHRYGVGREVRNIVLFTLGTGIGGGIIVDGSLYLGARGGAGELGHMTIDANGPKCGCGNTGCLEMLASGRAIERDAIARLRRGDKSSLSGIVKGNIESLTAAQVGEAARHNDAMAKDVLGRAAYYLGIGMVNAVNIFNPEMVICGGGMAELGEMMIGPGRKMVAERAFSISAESVQIVKAQLGNEAGVYGAAAYVLECATRRAA